MKQSLLLLSVLLASVSVAKDGTVPEKWNLEARQKFAEQRFGIFIHWGLYANYAQGEWYLNKSGVRESDYSQMMYGFYPSKFDARQWVKLFKKAGAKYVTITSRHHDGFSLWPTKVDDGYNIANTPFKRDILGELAQACAEEELQLNFYYSLMDWHREDYPTGRETRARNTLRKDRVENYASYKKFMMAQITELLDNYHPGNIWFDGEWDHDAQWSAHANPMDWGMDEINALIHSKHALVANNHHSKMRDSEDIQLFERDLPGENKTGFSADQAPIVDRPIEQCDVLQARVWGYKIEEPYFRSAEEVVSMVARAAGRGANLLMNVGPMGSGELPAKAVETLEKCAGWFDKNGESIYGTSACGITTGQDIVTTRRGNILYVHFLNPRATMAAFKMNGEILSATALSTGKSVSCERTAKGDVVLAIERPAEDTFDYVVKVVTK